MNISIFQKKELFLLVAFCLTSTVYPEISENTVQQELLTPIEQHEIERPHDVGPEVRTDENNPSEDGSDEPAIDKEAHEALLEQLTSMLNKLEGIGQFLNQVMVNKGMKLRNPENALEYVRNFTQLAHELNKETATLIHAQPEHLQLLLAIINEMGNNLLIAIESNLQELTEPDFEKLIQKRSVITPSIESLQIKLEENTELLEELDKKAQKIGLSFFQQTFRTLEKWDNQYNIRGKIVKAAVGSFLITYFISQFDKETLQRIPLVNTLKKYIGDYPTYTPKGQLLYQYPISVLDANGNETYEAALRNYTWFGHTINYLGLGKLRILNHQLEPVIGISAAFLFFKNDALRLLEKAREKLALVSDYLRGGPRSKNKGGKREARYTFDNVIGQEYIKSELQILINYICEPDRYERRGVTPNLNVLFAGFSRTGKTYMAEAFVGELNKQLAQHGKSPVTFYEFDGADIHKFGPRTLFAVAQEDAPAVIFIDEIEKLNLESLMSEFLIAMSGVMQESVRKVIFIGACNDLHRIPNPEPFLKRFGNVLWFDYPNLQERGNALIQEFDNHAIFVSDNFLQQVAFESEGATFEQLHQIIVKASQKVEQEHRAISEQDLQEVFDNVIWGIVPKPSPLTKDQKYRVAVHLAGNAIAHLALNPTAKLAKVTVKEVRVRIKEEPQYMRYERSDNDKKPTEHGKVLTYVVGDQLQNPDYNDVKKQCKILAAGMVAEKTLLGAESTYHYLDRDRIYYIARYITCNGDVHGKTMPKQVYQQKLADAYAFVEQCIQEMTELITGKKQQLEYLAQILHVQETLSIDEIEYILSPEFQEHQKALAQEQAEKKAA